MNEWVNLISSVGFPIICCVMLWQFQRTTMQDFSTKLEKNTEMMTKLYEKIDVVIFESGDDHDKNNISHE